MRGLFIAVFIRVTLGYWEAASADEYQPKMTPPRTDVAPFEYVDAKVPFYPAAGPRKGDGEWGKMQLPLAPAESLKHYQTPDDFELRLFAAEPDIGKSLAMAWDERGRLWLCESLDYPNELQPPGQGRDRIRICEDTDGDGRADKFTIFAERLSIPTSIAFHRGGAIVQNGVETIYLRDTDGDDRADVRRVLLTGWALGDTHGGVNNFHYGLDNWYWGMQGYNTSSPKAPATKDRPERAFGTFRMGFFRFRMSGDDEPVVEELEFVRSTSNNTWGLGFSETGDVFGSTANRNPSVFMPIANRYYEAVRGWSPQVLEMISPDHYFSAVTDKVRQVDHHGGFTAAAGYALYTARNYPPAYWNRTAFVCEPTAHLVATFVIEPHGAGFRSRNAWNLVASDDEWAAPIMAEVGPDGNVWVLDWYNFIVQHNPTPVGFVTGKGNAYETELRDKGHGRVFRVVPKGWKEQEPHSLAPLSPLQLVAEFRNPNMFWRLHAQRQLVEWKAMEVVNSLIELIIQPRIDEIGLDVGAIHALWTLRGLGVIEKDANAAGAVYAALKSQSTGVRMNAVQVLPRNEFGLNALIDLKSHYDLHTQTRLQALLALAEMPVSQAAATTLAALLAQDPPYVQDGILRDAIIAAAARHDRLFLQEMIAQAPALEPFEAEIVARVAEHYGRGKPTKYIDSLLNQIAGSNSPARTTVLAGLARGWPRNAEVALDAKAEAAIERMLESLPDAEQADLVQLAEKLGSKTVTKHAEQIAVALLAKAKDAKLDDAVRVEAARKAVSFRKADPALPGQLLAIITARSSPEFAQGILAAVGQSEVPAVGGKLIDRLDSLTPAARPAAISLLLARAEWTAALVEALAARRLPIGELSLDQKQALAAHPDADLARRAKQMLNKVGGLPNADRQKVLAELLPLSATKGDAAAGKLVFTRQCAKCHMHSGEGQKIGPDLTGMAAHPKQELLAHLIDPSRSVEGNFRVYTVVTADGLVLNGLLASETKTAIELIDAEGKRRALPRDEIEELTASTKSIMPEGFEKQVTREELTNLLEFLTARGRYFPLDLRKVASAVSTKGLFTRADAVGERLVFDDWSPKSFAGVPFTLVDPQGDRTANIVLLHGPNGYLAPRMPKSVRLPCNAAVKTLHLLGGVGGWNFPASRKGTTSLVVRLHYADGKSEDHRLVNGEHVADYIRRTDVPGSQFAFDLGGRQVRYLAVTPRRTDVVREIEFAKGDDDTAPIIMAATVETGEQQ